ncbi:class I tRNA ligase family protein [Candidatus Wolfebacteria bacterium]|nr:class I tRNA ligase family protein [Candidatus Wolfebacteria bacterium]
MAENKKFSINELEKEVSEFWKKNRIFEKSVEKPAGKKPKDDYVFFDGPPFATGTPHYGHIVASVMKDAVPRYWTMKGYRVKRRWGWDCHGLPIENIAEKELNIKRKKEIEEMGIGKFNEFCRSKIFGYVDEWKKVIDRLGRWVDMENSYKTMDASFMESVWWVFKELWDKNLIYENYRSMHVCPRCETTLSQQEVSEGYKNIKDLSAIVKFKLKPNQAIGNWMSGNRTYLLAWTTTPWTLPGNVALAVGKNIQYSFSEKDGDEIIFAKDSPVAKILGTISKGPVYGVELIGKFYEPLFDYYSKDNSLAGELKNREQGWQIYAGDFVTIEDGTGIVHIAPAFGEDDFKLMEKYNLPFIQHVGMDGIIKPEVKDFSGVDLKPRAKNKPEEIRETDLQIVKFLEDQGKIFDSKKYEHSYPHCWRCDTPLINYATSSWFVNILKTKDKAIKLAKGINWSPEHIKEGRFGKWLEGARDWSISRQRYWASAMPIWKCANCKAIKVIGSVDDIKKSVKKSGNKYFIMRHGEAEQNVKDIINSNIENNHFHLTQKGKKQVLVAAQKLKKGLKKENIDLIFASDFLRIKETAEIITENIGFAKSKIIFDKRLREVNTGIFNNKKSQDYHDYFSSLEEKFYKIPPEGENLTELKNRITEFLYEIEGKYSDKNILILSHEYPIWCLFAGAKGFNLKEATGMKEGHNDFIKTGEILNLNFAPLPHNNNYELDLHRPYIDEIKFDCECGGKMKRISDVLDTWFDSGSMPYAQAHYPFENKKEFEKNFPAEFIAEGLDQTRAWFYYLHCIAAAIKNSRAFSNAIVNGIVLAEDGKKMSKKLKNYPDPIHIIDKYGADALRLYILSSPVVAAENLNFSEAGVDEIYKKVIMRLWNSYQFYEMYGEKIKISKFKIKNSKNILDKWILARLNQLIAEISKSMDEYKLDRAARPIGDFVEDLSTWYIRRSRERFKTEGNDKKVAIETTKFVLEEFSKVIAPFAPFMAEKIYQNLGNKNSVHLENFPKIDKKAIDKKLIEAMVEIRKICSLGLEARQKAGIKVRQPLSELIIKNFELRNNKELLELIKDEINVKEIIFDKNIADEVELDIKITPELKEEGQLRELTRAIQDLRKKSGFLPEQKIILEIQTNAAGEKLINKFEPELKKNVGVKEIKIKSVNGEFLKIDEFEFRIEIKK